jgi:hypothetical protein
MESFSNVPLLEKYYGRGANFLKKHTGDGLKVKI